MKPHPQDPKGEAGSKKTPLHLTPPYAMAQASLAHALGAEKYGAFNWRENGVNATTYVGAMLRHLNAWRDGENNDPESGVSHLAHIIASANILLDAGHCGKLVDDRSKTPKRYSFGEMIAKLMEVHPPNFEKARVAEETPSADPGEDYVTLPVGETVQSGDEFSAGEDDWRKSHCVGMVIREGLGYPYRRAVK
jgi:hypothetical protein